MAVGQANVPYKQVLSNTHGTASSGGAVNGHGVLAALRMRAIYSLYTQAVKANHGVMPYLVISPSCKREKTMIEFLTLFAGVCVYLPLCGPKDIANADDWHAARDSMVTTNDVTFVYHCDDIPKHFLHAHMISYDVSYYLDEPKFSFQLISDACTTYSCLDLSNGLCYESGSQHYIKDQQARRVVASYKGAPETYVHKFSPFDGTVITNFCGITYSKSHSETIEHIQVSTWGAS